MPKVSDLSLSAAHHMVKLAIEMRRSQKWFYAQRQQSEDRRAALKVARNNEEAFDRLTREIDVD